MQSWIESVPSSMAHDKEPVYRWGIIGCGRISSDFCNTLSVYSRAKIIACAARKLASARDFARKYDIDSYYDNYEQLAKDDRVDIVYVGTIHPVHVSNVLLCLKNGKHVLCEKPMGVNYSETMQMIDCARRNRRFLLEGIWTRYFPAIQQCKKWINNGQIGSPMALLCDFGLYRSPPSKSPISWRNDLCGGGFMSLGCYVVDPLLRAFGPKMPSVISAVGSIDEEYNVDTVVAVNVFYPETKQFAQINCNAQVKTMEECTISGSTGMIRIKSPHHCPVEVELWKSTPRSQELMEAKKFPLDAIKVKYADDMIFPNSEGFIYQIEHVTECLDKGLLESPGYTWSEMVMNCKISDEIRKQIGLKYPQDSAQSKL